MQDVTTIGKGHKALSVRVRAPATPSQSRRSVHGHLPFRIIKDDILEALV